MTALQNTLPKKRIAVLISGGGTNLQALIDACEKPDFPAEIVLVISNKKEAFGLERAKKAQIPTKILSHKDYETREHFDRELHETLVKSEVDLVCLAGFLRLLTSHFVEQWHNKLINIHPSLLPAFKGLNVHQRALDAGVRFTGCTVHIVRAEMDAGPIIIQAAVPILQNDTESILAARILKSEHEVYPKALYLMATGDAYVEGDKVLLKNRGALPDSLIHPIL